MAKKAETRKPKFWLDTDVKAADITAGMKKHTSIKESAADTAAKAAEAAAETAADTKKEKDGPSVGEKLGGLKGGLLTLWQLVKFSIVGLIGGVIQLIFQLILPFIFDGITTTLPNWLDFMYDEATMFDTTTAAGAADAAKYIIDGTVTWGYVLPFFLANIIANIFCYVENKKRTFKSHAPEWHFVVYFVIMVLTIVAMTWLQGALYPILMNSGITFFMKFSRVILLLPCGLIQTIVFFITQKILLPPDPDPEDEAKKEAEEDAKILAGVTAADVEAADRKLDELLKSGDHDKNIF